MAAFTAIGANVATSSSPSLSNRPTSSYGGPRPGSYASTENATPGLLRPGAPPVAAEALPNFGDRKAHV